MMWNGPFGMIGGWGWFWPFHFIFPLMFLALIITAVVMLVRYATGRGDHPPWPERRPPGLDVLEERYARGEINRDEYLQRSTTSLDKAARRLHWIGRRHIQFADSAAEFSLT